MSQARGVPPEALRAEMVQAAAFKRTVTEADVVQTTLFLCSSAANTSPARTSTCPPAR